MLGSGSESLVGKVSREISWPWIYVNHIFTAVLGGDKLANLSYTAYLCACKTP